MTVNMSIENTINTFFLYFAIIAPCSHSIMSENYSTTEVNVENERYTAACLHCW